MNLDDILISTDGGHIFVLVNKSQLDRLYNFLNKGDNIHGACSCFSYFIVKKSILKLFLTDKKYELMRICFGPTIEKKYCQWIEIE